MLDACVRLLVRVLEWRPTLPSFARSDRRQAPVELQRLSCGTMTKTLRKTFRARIWCHYWNTQPGAGVEVCRLIPRPQLRYEVHSWVLSADIPTVAGR
jgi:hypothetical protein